MYVEESAAAAATVKTCHVYKKHAVYAEIKKWSKRVIGPNWDLINNNFAFAFAA